jgi:hypothetical protein
MIISSGVDQSLLKNHQSLPENRIFIRELYIISIITIIILILGWNYLYFWGPVVKDYQIQHILLAETSFPVFLTAIWLIPWLIIKKYSLKAKTVESDEYRIETIEPNTREKKQKNWTRQFVFYSLCLLTLFIGLYTFVFWHESIKSPRIIIAAVCFVVIVIILVIAISRYRQRNHPP